MTLTNAKVLIAAAIVAATGAAAGCGAEEDDRPVRNPGGLGGTGGMTGGATDGGGTTGDSGLVDGSGGGDGMGTDTDGGGSNDGGSMGDGGVMSLTGQVCIVSDLRQPDACPAVANRAGVTVRVRGTGASAVSGADGRFAIAASGAVVLELAEGAVLLESAVVPAAAATPLVNAPVISSQDWQAVLDAIGQVQPDDAGAIVLYVEDAGGAAVSGATMDGVAGSTVVPHYDDGAALAWRTAGGTGTQGVALFLDVAPGTVTLNGLAPGPLPVTLAGVPVIADAITFVRVRLAAP